MTGPFAACTFTFSVFEMIHQGAYLVNDVSLVYVKHVLSRSVMFDFATPWTVACQAPLFHGLLQARILEWVAMPSSRGSSRD